MELLFHFRLDENDKFRILPFTWQFQDYVFKRTFSWTVINSHESLLIRRLEIQNMALLDNHVRQFSLFSFQLLRVSDEKLTLALQEH